MMRKRSEGSGVPWRVRSIWKPDLWAALVAAGIAFIVTLTTSDLLPEPIYFAILAGAAGTLGGLVLHRAVGLRDRLLSDEYGEIVRSVDPDAGRLMFPYFFTATIAGISMIVSVLAAIFIKGIDSRVGQAVVIAIAALFFAWTVFGFLYLLFLESRHSRSMNRIQGMKEQSARTGRSAPSGRAK